MSEIHREIPESDRHSVLGSPFTVVRRSGEDDWQMAVLGRLGSVNVVSEETLVDGSVRTSGWVESGVPHGETYQEESGPETILFDR